VPERADVTLNAAGRAGIDHGRRSHGLSLPTKKAGVEIRSLADVAASDLEVNYRLTHNNASTSCRKCQSS
jgi:hypothetical protein